MATIPTNVLNRDISDDQLEKALAALLREREARYRARMLAPNYHPRFIWIERNENPETAYAKARRQFPGEDVLVLGWARLDATALSRAQSVEVWPDEE